jgi:Asp-tRNA(Asn)/Glu-tRNA(Gln) amidotransferase A subunit family amidase
MPVHNNVIANLSAAGLAILMRRKELSPVEVISDYLARIDQLNPALNAFVCINYEEALTEARQAELLTKQGDDARPLLGVPVTIKSCINVQNMLCEAGSRLRSGYIASEDATLVQRLKRAGAIVIGNTTVPEMLLAYHTENELHGRAANPWALDRTPGGSSGGEAAAIAACLSAGGIGSDGGGSIRVPAHFCGICGLKPTPGRVPATGHYPDCQGPFALIGVVGPMARTIADVRLLFEATIGYDSCDPASVPLPNRPVTKDELQKLKIGYYEEDGYSPVTPEIRNAVLTAAKALNNAKFEVEPFRPVGLLRARELWEVIFVEGIAMALRPMVQGRETELSSNTREFMALADSKPPLTGERLLNTLLERDQVRREILLQMEQFPILLSPVCSIPAFRHEEAGWGRQHTADYLRTMSYSQHYNLTGNPAAVVPIGLSPEGMPVGVQVIGRPFQEEQVLAVAEILDEQFGWKNPPERG